MTLTRPPPDVRDRVRRGVDGRLDGVSAGVVARESSPVAASRPSMFCVYTRASLPRSAKPFMSP